MRHLQGAYKGPGRYLNRGPQEAEAIHSSGQRYVEKENWVHGVRVVVCCMTGFLFCPYVVLFGYLYPASRSWETTTAQLENEYRDSVAEKRNRYKESGSPAFHLIAGKLQQHEPADSANDTSQQDKTPNQASGHGATTHVR